MAYGKAAFSSRKALPNEMMHAVDDLWERVAEGSDSYDPRTERKYPLATRAHYEGVAEAIIRLVHTIDHLLPLLPDAFQAEIEADRISWVADALQQNDRETYHRSLNVRLEDISVNGSA